MKFEKRSGDEAETPSSAPEETPSTGKKPVVIYIMILFIVAFLLMALSFLMHQRSNSEVLGELQDSVTAMQEVQATQDALLGDPRVKGFKTTRVVDVEVTDGKLSAAILENAQTGERTALPVDGIFVFLGPAGEPGTAGSVHHSAAVFCGRSGGLSSQHRRLRGV